MSNVIDLQLENSVAIFGSARVKQDHIHFVAAYNLANALAEKGINVLTGGGPGIMLAGNSGAKSAESNDRGKSVGIRIQLPFETCDSHKDHHDDTYDFDKFYTRQSTLVYNADCHVAFFGGFGTCFEIMEVLTLMQTGFLPRRIVWLYGEEYWADLMQMARVMADTGAISEDDIGLLQSTDRLMDIYEYILDELEK